MTRLNCLLARVLDRLTPRQVKKAAWLSLLVFGLLVVSVVPSQAHHGHHRHRRAVFVADSVWWWDPWYPYWWYPPPTYVYPPPSVVGDEPVEYIEQRAPDSSSRPEGFWFYCPTAKRYYPAVPTCPEQWVKVPPRPE
jgi:hypothetical protein